ncbi:ADGRB3 [Mytilus edulis]|uniref:ADGRB3 n=1 Tax=Mytilus edulis TaxID=6550 RepID=A0A8S3S644_MYTED|nr:ADGRB3 [Mytilus edulis]
MRPPKEGGKTCIHKGLNRKHSCNVQSATRPPKEEGGLNRKHSCNVQSAKRPPREEAKHAYTKENIPAMSNLRHALLKKEAKHAYTKALIENIPAMSNLRRPPREGGKTCIHKGLNRKHSCNVQSATRPPREGGKTCIRKGLNRKHSCNVQSVTTLASEKEAKHAYTKALIENIPAMSNERVLLEKEANMHTQRP